MTIDVGAELAIVAQLLLAAALGAAIGFEREIHDHPAGMRTHLLVSVGSATFTILSIVAFQAPGADPARVAAQIVSGIGFLGAGAILKEGASIRGLTTAASLWAVAGVGMAAGAGAWGVAIAVTIIVLVSLWPLNVLTDRFVGRDQDAVLLRLGADDAGALGRVVTVIGRANGTIAHLETAAAPDGGLTIEIEVRLRDDPAGHRLTAKVAEIDGLRIIETKALGD